MKQVFDLTAIYQPTQENAWIIYREASLDFSHDPTPGNRAVMECAYRAWRGML